MNSKHKLLACKERSKVASSNVAADMLNANLGFRDSKL